MNFAEMLLNLPESRLRDVIQQRIDLLADIQMKGGSFRSYPQRHLVHVHIGSPVHPLAEDGRALRGGPKGVNFGSGRVVQQLSHCIAIMSSDIEDRHGLDLAVSLSHRVVGILRVEQLFKAVHRGTLESAGDRLCVRRRWSRRSIAGLSMPPPFRKPSLRHWMASVRISPSTSAGTLIQSGLDISPVVTHRFPYTQFNEAIELMKSDNSGKIVLD